MQIKRGEKNRLDIICTIAEFAIEEYRFMRIYDSVVNKLFSEEKKRYISIYNYHECKIRELLDKFNLKIISFDGQEYDEGLPVTPLNADEFDTYDQLVVEQTFNPTVITSEGNIVIQGTVSLARKRILEENNTSEDEE